ncbi:FAD-dependent oxidoreductase [Azonexus sp. R2A61]|uniref:FAD-dependent oxidoreductase n=1 Tax=Azonexus sp. R2A61 TaxID=2744443 RepID=UPI001F3DED9D|nr:FAD-dependent oxidoreductase [Azonexus sp. R2A61]
MAEKFDVIVVGAGMAGNAAAYTLAKGGLNVLQIERGETPGSKNVQGAILYADAIEKIIPDFRDEAPLERHLIEQRVWVLDDSSYIGTHYRSEAFNQEPYNRYTIIRAHFDQWFNKKAREAGALTICETTVSELLLDGKKVIGVRTDRKGGEIYADAVILADGVNSRLAVKAGFHAEIQPRDVALAVKEIHFLPQETIEARFNIGEEEGVVIEMAGKISAGMMGTGFLYTNKESITLGVGCMLSDFKQQKVTPYALLDRMKSHPSIAPLIAGSEMKEYAAHLIPEGGYNAIPQVWGDGWLIAGDAGQFVNGIHREGSNLAMTTGMLAAQTLVELKQAGKPFTAGNLAKYKRKLDDSFVMKDLKKYRRMPDIFHKNKQFFTTYPELLSKAAQTLIRVDGVDKKTKEKSIKQSFVAARSRLGLIGDAFRFWRAVE